MAKTSLSIPGTVYASRGKLFIMLPGLVRRTDGVSNYFTI